MKNILVYGDVDLRYTDGSGVWLASLVRVLSMTDCRPHLLLKSRMGTGGLFDDLRGIPDLHIIDDFSSGRAKGSRFSQEDAALRIEELVQELRIDVVVCRGLRLCSEVARLPQAGPRLWAYMTDIPQTAREMVPPVSDRIGSVARVAHRMFAQTEEARDFLEFHIPQSRGKTLLLPPMLPEISAVPDGPREGERPLRLVYAGKFARAWNTLEMCAIPAAARDLGLTVELTMIGDKFQEDPGDPSWSSRMREALENSPGVTWLGGMSRHETLREIQEHDLGMAWRSQELDYSHEISTKLLEYLACGTPPVLNRTVMHEALLGADYPGMVDRGEILRTVRAMAGQDFRAVVDDCRPVARRFSMAEASARLGAELDRAIQEPAARGRVQLVARGSGAFLDSVRTMLASCRRVEMVDADAASGHDGEQSPVVGQNRSEIVLRAFDDVDPAALADVPTIAVWDGGRWPQPDSRHASLVGLVVPDENLRIAAARWSGLPVGSVYWIPEHVDLTACRRKLENARFNVALVLEPENAPEVVRLGTQLLSSLLELDRRFVVHFAVQGTRVVANHWAEELVADSLVAMAQSPECAGSWSLEPVTDVATWLRKIGWIGGLGDDSVGRLVGSGADLSGTVRLPVGGADLQSPDPWLRTIQSACSQSSWSELSASARASASPPSDRFGDLFRLVGAAGVWALPSV